jgi:hypothetical protein
MNLVVPNHLPSKPKAFLSHATADKAWVTWLAEHARALGVEPYLAEHDHQAGRPLSDKVVEAIESSTAVIVLLTRNGYDSGYVQQEIGVARGARKLVIALVDIALDPPPDLALLEGVEHVRFDFANATEESTVPLFAALHQISLPSEAVQPQPAAASSVLRVKAQGEFQLEINEDLLQAAFVTAIVLGLIYLAVRSIDS